MASVFPRYTESARRAVFFARWEAALRDDQLICPRHILAGLTWESESRVARLASLKSRAVKVHALLSLPHLPTKAVPEPGEPPLDNDAKKTLAYTVLEADRDWQYWIDTDHLLRGLLRFDNETTEALSAEGLTLEPLREASARDRREHAPKTAPLWGAIRLFARRSKYVWIVILILLFALFLRWMGPA